MLIGLFALSFVLTNYGLLTSEFGIETGNGGRVNVLSSDYSFPDVWANLGYYYGWMFIFVCLAIIISITNEFRYKTHRQNIIDGLSRMDFVHAKVALIVALNVILVLFYILTGLVFGFFGDSEFSTEGMINVLYTFVMGLNYLGFAALLAFLIKRSGLAITLFIAYVIFEGLIIRMIARFTGWELGDYFPLEASDNLFVFPLNATAKAMVNAIQGGPSPTTLVVISCVYIALYYGIIRWKMSKSDL